MTVEDDTKTDGPISRRRLWLFRLIGLTVIPAVVLLTLEVSLRVVGYGYNASVLNKIEWKGQPAYCDNFSFGWRFWPKTIAREFEPFTFTANKAKDTYRVFILGGSAAQGTPEPAYSFSRSLEVMLESQYAGVDFEVINAALTASNSHVSLPIANELACRDGDLFIVYLGNNEVIGPYGAGTIFATLSDNMSFIRFDKAVQTVRLGQLFKNTLKGQQGDRTVPDEWGGTKMFMENLIRSDDERLGVVYKHFKSNLEDIIRVIRKKDAEVILCSVGSNLKDNAPFASLHRPDITASDRKKWDSLYAQGVEYEVSGEHEKAIESFQEAGKIDNTYADLHFRIARAYWQHGNFEKAREEFIIARQRDALRLRADDEINRTIFEVADSNKGEGVYYVDSVKAFEQVSPHNTPGEELFYEHVHLNFKGNYILAKTVFGQVEKILPEWVKNKRTDSTVASEQQCSERLAYTDWDKYKITQVLLNESIKVEPFTSRLYNDDLVRLLEQELKDTQINCDKQHLTKASQQYLKAIDNAPEDWWLRRKYALLLTQGLEDHRSGVEQYRVMSQLLPGYYMGHAERGLALLAMGDFDGAVAGCLESLRINPSYANAYNILGVCYDQKGDTQKALECYAMQIKLRPGQSDGYNGMGVILDKQGEQARAEDVYREGLFFSPDDEALHFNLALLLAKQKRFGEAIETLKVGLKAKPDSVPLGGLLNQIMAAG